MTERQEGVVKCHKCPRCNTQREDGLFGEWRLPAIQRTVNCLLCRLLLITKGKTDDGKSEERKQAFRAELAAWLDARVEEKRLSDFEKQNVLARVEGFKYMKLESERVAVSAPPTPVAMPRKRVPQNNEADEPSQESPRKSLRLRFKTNKLASDPAPVDTPTSGNDATIVKTPGKAKQTTSKPRPKKKGQASQSEEQEERQTPWIPLKDEAFLEKAAKKVNAIEAELGPSKGPIEGEDLIFDTTTPRLSAPESSSSVPIIPRDQDTFIEFMGAINKHCIAFENIFRAYITGHSDLEELVKSKPLYRELLAGLLKEDGVKNRLRQ
ncbi:MAG: hypothetical protein M1831_001002 [Alyxoria varia]|nr:MAG: hypothetical protein M1831_001002 [Alyxoria varia]